MSAMDSIRARVAAKLATVPASPTPSEDTSPSPLDAAEAAFTRWLGTDYDLDALRITLAVAASERLTGDPVWLLYISGSGNAKTETIQSVQGAGGIVTSTITSEGALLSATPKREKERDANGGLLRRIGERGILIIKDVTTILSMNRDSRAGVLAALREIHDGRWERNVGTDGGRSLTWQGRLVVIGACTTAWDTHREVIATMGDRFVTIRSDSGAGTGRTAAGRRAIANTGAEVAMRQELADAVAAVIGRVNPSDETALRDHESEAILRAADIVTLARTAIECDYRGDPIDAHAPEMPTRFAKQLAQVFRGAVAIGLSRPDALRLAIRCARDSMPPLRLAILADVAAHPHSPTRDVRRRLDKPRMTVDRQLQALHLLGLVTCDEDEAQGIGSKVTTTWRYRLAEGIDLACLTVPGLSPHIHANTEERETHRATDIPGTVKGCCEGGPMLPKCRLCRESATYWQAGQ
jgi:hypothetical protein